MSPPAKKDSTGKKGNPNWTDREPPAQNASAPSSQTEESQSPQYGDRNPNWTDRELPTQTSQQSDTDSEESEPPRYGDRNPNWTDRDLPSSEQGNS